MDLVLANFRRERAEKIAQTTTLNGDWKLRFDGASRRNPGPSSCAAVIISEPNEDVIWFDSDYIGHKTSNVAEYSGLLLGLKAIVNREYKSFNPMQTLSIEGDSELVIKQLKGEYECKHKKLLPLFHKAQDIINKIRNEGTIVTLQHIPREQNKFADSSANIILDRELETGDWTPNTGVEWIAEHDPSAQNHLKVRKQMNELKEKGLSDPEILFVQEAKYMAGMF